MQRRSSISTKGSPRTRLLLSACRPAVALLAIVYGLALGGMMYTLMGHGHAPSHPEKMFMSYAGTNRQQPVANRGGRAPGSYASSQDTPVVALPTGPGTGAFGIHTLDELPPGTRSKMTWLDQGRWLHTANSELLKQNRASSPPATLTLVTVMLDLGRHKLGGGFARPFSEYINRMRSFMAYDLPKVVFLDRAHLSEFQPLIDGSPGPVHVIPFSTEQLQAEFPWHAQVQAIRGRESWSHQQEWLSHSPQATLEFYNPLVMSKVNLTLQAAALNPFKTEGFLFIDAGHLCNQPAAVNKKNQALIGERYMSRGMTITFFDYTPATHNGEVHGFEAAAFQEYIGDTELPLRVGRGGFFGGRPSDMAVAQELIELMLTETLGKGLMGTEENMFAMLDYRFGQNLVDRFDNGAGGNCAVWADILNPVARIRDEDVPLRLRSAKCSEDWKQLSEQGQPSCYTSGVACPAHVTPKYVLEAPQQYTCQDLEHFYCTVECTAAGEVKWYAHACGGPDQQPCPGLPTLPKTPEELKAEKDMELPVGEFYDLRGLLCGQLPDGSARCYSADPLDRDMCPEHVTPEYLTAATGQGTCAPSSTTHFCTASCRNGEQIAWWAHEIKWCQDNPDNCPPRPQHIPKSEFQLQPYELPDVPARTCRAEAGLPARWDGLSENEEGNLRGSMAQLGAKPELHVSGLTVGMLVYGSKELDVVRATLDTYERHGLFEGLDEMIIYMNAKDSALEAALQPYVEKHRALRTLGSTENVGILGAMNALVAAAQHPTFLFLEKDFKLIEPWTCASEQLRSGMQLLSNGTAQVVRFRHRWRAGKPNHARNMFEGDEDRVFGQQPNLFCNHFHWVKEPEKRWPDKMWKCAYTPTMYCSLSKYCNWTNNPSMFQVAWWMDEYVNKRFKAEHQHDPYRDIEFYMNWQAGAWNDEGWVVAQGEGMFRHEDPKWG